MLIRMLVEAGADITATGKVADGRLFEILLCDVIRLTRWVV